MTPILPVVLLAAAAVTAPPPPSSTPPSVKLTLMAAASDTPWTMRVENTGSVPYMLIADARLVVLDITPPNAPPGTKPVRCTLPLDMRPTGSERALVVPPQRAYVETFDPRMICFAPNERAALVPGAIVVAHLGWPAATPATTMTPAMVAKANKAALVGPFIISALDGVEPRVAAAKEIESAPWPVPAAMVSQVPQTTPASVAIATSTLASEGEPKLSLELPASGDTELGTEAWTTLTLHNESTQSVTLLYRIETIGFDVIGPLGMIRCGEPRAVDSPIRELFTTIAPGGRAEIPVLLSAMCPNGALDQPGLYSVRPVMDTRHASGRKVGVRSFDGMVIGQTPQLVRIRHARRPSLPERPVLE